MMKRGSDDNIPPKHDDFFSAWDPVIYIVLGVTSVSTIIFVVGMAVAYVQSR